jgi:hypothetical protein
MSARRLTALLAITIALAAASGSALGYWTGFDTPLHGTGAGGAAQVNQGAAPTAESHGTHVILSWGASSLTSGAPVDGYIVKRYDAVTDTPQQILTNCTGTITGTACTELDMPLGDWKYTVTPVIGDNWRGPESSHSGPAETGPSVLLLDRPVVGAPLPTEMTGTLTGFVENEGLTFELDGVPISGSPASADAGGDATLGSLTIPAGTGDGPHTLKVIGDDADAPSDAEASFLVDTTPPTFSSFVTPTPNAAGWNNTSPVEVNGVAEDGTGSGVAGAMYTDDGSDPKTSPTAMPAVPPILVSTTSTLKAYVIDVAGNESEVQTREVKIDTLPPLFTVEFIDVVGNFYTTPTGPQGQPGLAFYRGIEAGSLRFKMIPTPMGGSPAVSAGFTDLPPDAVGFSFDSSSVTTPEGGPYVSNVFSWVAGTTSTPAGTISMTNAAGSTFGTSGEITNDSSPPTGGSVDATGLTGSSGRYSQSMDLSLSLAQGTDAGGGVADGSAPTDLPLRLMRASAPLTSANGIAEGICGTYGSYAQVGADNPATTVSDTVPDDATCYRYRYLVPDHLSNTATYESPDIKVLATPAPSLRPTDATITPLSGTGAQSVAGSTVFYNPALEGSFHVDSSASAPSVGVAAMTFPAMGGFAGGGAVTSPSSGTTFRTTYTWAGNGASSSPGSQPISATNYAGATSTNPAAFTVVKDDTAPSAGSVDAIGLGGTGGRYSTSTSLSLGLNPGSDAGSGLATSGRRLMRASASLSSNGTSDGICGTFGSFGQIGAGDPASPVTDVVPVDGTCYRYQYLVPDKVGNQATYTSPDIKVAPAPPAPALSFSSLTNAYWSGAGTAIFYRPGAASGGFTVNATSADTTSGSTGYVFPTLPGGWSGSSGGTGVHNYSWSPANPTAPSGGQAVTATNNAGGQSSTSFTATPDSAAPSGGTVTYPDGYSSAATVSVGFTQGTDAGAGLAGASGFLQRSTATLTNGICGTFSAFTTFATNPTSPQSAAQTTGNCYQYRYLVSDNLGNQATYSSANVVKVDTQAPTNALSLNSAVGASLSGTVLYYKSNAIGSFKLVNAVADAASGPASTTFPIMSTTGWVHNAETISTPAAGPYTSTAFSWTANPTNPTAKTVTGRDAAALTTNASVTFVTDTTAPASGSVSYTNGLFRTLSVPVTTANGTDAGSGIDTASGTLQRSTAVLNTDTQSCGTFGSFTTVTLSGGADTGVTSGNCYQYRYLVSDKVGNQATYTSANVARVDTTTYSAGVLADAGLVNYYRLGESTISSDTFTGAAGTLLSSRSGEIGATWSAYEAPPTTAVLSNENRVRRNGVSGTQYTTSGVPPSADYSVQADIVIKSVLSDDAAGVAARAVAGDDFYFARLRRQGGTTAWELVKIDAGIATALATAPATVSAGQTHTVKLSVVGSRLTMWVNGSVIAATNDASFTAAGKAGLRLGFTGATPAPTDTTGLHMDNFVATPLAADSKGTNPGEYFDGPTLGATGAISGDSNTAAQFDGVRDYVSVARQIQDNFTIEFWFKSTQGTGTNAQWWGNAGLVDAEVGGAANDFGTSLRSDGRVVAGIGAPDVSIVSASAGYNDGAWHHVAFTRTRTSGALALYIDGVAAGTATGASTLSLTSPPAITFGRQAAGAWNYVAGTLDEVAFYNTVLSQATISSHYARR